MNSTAQEMTRKAVIVITLVLAAGVSVVAQFQGADPVRQKGKVCGFNLLSGFSFSSNNEAKQVLDTVIEAAGFLPDHFVILAADVDNAYACEDKNSSNRYILFSPSWIRGLTGSANKDAYWIRVGILAHEVGHHALNHFLRGTASTPQLELEADEYAGRLLATLGATPTQAQSAFRLPEMCDEQGGNTHPKCADRLAAVARGWHQVNDSRAPGTPIPLQSHVVACKEKGLWCPDKGYEYVNNDPSDHSVRWQPGKPILEYPHVIACPEEGRVCPEPGYEYVNADPSDHSVRWQPGKAHPSHPHVVACQEEERWCTEIGYIWVMQGNPPANNYAVRLAP